MTDLDPMRLSILTIVAQLIGTPVEVTFDGNRLKEWRVLEEVL